MSKCVNCLKEINEKEVFCLTCHEEVLGCAKNQIANLEAKLAEKEKQLENAQNLKAIEVADELSLKLSKIHNQDKISFAVDILEELADCSNYINSKLDFESGSYVSEKSIRDKIKYLKGNKYE